MTDLTYTREADEFFEGWESSVGTIGEFRGLRAGPGIAGETAFFRVDMTELTRQSLVVDTRCPIESRTHCAAR